MQIDLDAARAARREANGEAPTVLFDGKTFTLPVELPFTVAEAISKLQTSNDPSGLVETIEAFLGEQASEFLESKPSINDVQTLVEGLSRAYGFADSGESSASPAPS